MVLTFLPWYTARQLDIDGLVLIAPMGSMWLLFGLGLLRGFPVSGARAVSGTGGEA